MSDNKKSNTVYISRCIALICIVCAHSSIGSDRILNAFANSGVAIFFIASGIYYKPYSIFERLKRIKSLMIPWFVLGSGTYFLNAFIAGSFKPCSWLLWLLGYNTYLWYLTIYVVSLLLFSLICIEKYKIIQWLLIFVMIFSRLICSAKCIEGPPAFLNPLNWMGFITLGMLISDKFTELFHGKRAHYMVGISVISVVALGMLGQYLGEKTHYFGWTSVFSQFAWSYLILYVSARIGQMKIMLNLGKNSLPLYLLHISLINWICSRIGTFGILCVAISMLVVLFLYAIFVMAEAIAHKNKYTYMIWTSVTGFQKM